MASKVCKVSAVSANIKLFKRHGKKQRQAVAMALSILRRACGCHAKRRMTPKEMVACKTRRQRRA